MDAVKDESLAAAFGARLRELRTAAGLSQSQLGERVRPPIHSQASARYEAGAVLPNLSALYRLAAALGVSPAELLPEAGPPRKKKRSTPPPVDGPPAPP